MRCFIGIAASTKLKDSIYELIEEIRPILHAKFVEKENLHLTLNFLGELREDEVNSVKETINNVNVSRFFIGLHGLDCYPSPMRARVLWIGITEGRGELEALLKNFRGNTPHMTIARFNEPINATSIVNNYSTHYFGRMEINEIVLFQSVLTPKGPIYIKFWSRIL
ncbi:MAG: RNA 2',3'-cyclic phosphodiesterase [Candidatus Aenigmarchaeota archaeon]|nr:RNA 2',3'-cyclic phosphodiesterase [Candidatus Aenigmarchaeota archaeon]